MYLLFFLLLRCVIPCRNRLMIPICDPEGAVIGFGARLLPSAEQKPQPLLANATSDATATDAAPLTPGAVQSATATAKYVNSPETVLFKKVSPLIRLWFIMRMIMGVVSLYIYTYVIYVYVCIYELCRIIFYLDTTSPAATYRRKDTLFWWRATSTPSGEPHQCSLKPTY